MQYRKWCAFIDNFFFNLGAEKRDDVNNFVRKIRAKNIQNILFILETFRL